MAAQDPRNASLYRNVPPEQTAALREFRATHPVRQVALNRRAWPYICTGQGTDTILLLPGALGIAESPWQQIRHFALRFRVISVSYPAVDTMAELTDGIAAILDQEGIASAHVVGGSYGGLVAQVFARRHRDRTARLVLSHTGPPDPRRERLSAAALRWMRVLPEWILRAIFRLQMSALAAPATHPEAALGRAYFEEILRDYVTKPYLIAFVSRSADFDSRYVFTPTDLADRAGSVLLIMADNDPATPPRVRQAMRELYPGAQMKLFSGTGHSASVLKREEYLGAIQAFLTL